MANIASFDAIKSGDAVLASVVSNNFTKIAAAVNSNALDSNNYGISSILSQHISTGQIVSQHILAGGVGSANLGQKAVVHDKMNFASSDGGVRVLQIGDAASNMPANGVIAGRYSQTLAITHTDGTAEQTFAFTNAIDGSPGFTGTPQVGNPAFLVPAATDSAPVAYNLTALNSNSAVFQYVFSATQNITVTTNLIAVGPK